MVLNRTMIIIWKWEDLKQAMDAHFPVQNSASDKIIRINAKKSEQLLKDLMTILKSDNGQKLVFFHKDHGFGFSDIDALGQLEPEFNMDSVKFYLFGGGKDYLYFSASEEGLLDDFGWFMNEPEYEFQFSTPPGKIGHASVVTKNRESDKWELLPQYFEKVWRYYWFSLKKTVFELKEDLLRALVIHDLNPVSCFKSELLLRLRVQQFSGLVDKTGIKQEDYLSEPYMIFEQIGTTLQKNYGNDAVDKYKMLATSLTNILTSDAPVSPATIRDQFDAFLEAVA